MFYFILYYSSLKDTWPSKHYYFAYMCIYIYIYIYLAIDYITTNKAALSLVVYSLISLVLCSRPKIVLHGFCLSLSRAWFQLRTSTSNRYVYRLPTHGRGVPLVVGSWPTTCWAWPSTFWAWLYLFTLDFTPIIHACGWQLQLLFSSVGSIVLLENKEFYELKSMKLPNPTSTIIYIYIYIFQSYL